MANQKAHEIHIESKPHNGDKIYFKNKFSGFVVRVEENLCWVDYIDGGVQPFIWCFQKTGLNSLHEWDRKNTGRYREAVPRVATVSESGSLRVRGGSVTDSSQLSADDVVQEVERRR